MKLRKRPVSGFHACWMNAAKRAVSVSDNRVSPLRSERGREEQGAGVVVDAVAVRAVRHRIDGVLQHARAVAEREEMPDPNFRKRAFLARKATIESTRGDIAAPALSLRGLENREIALGRLRPGHRSARRVGALAHGIAADIVRQQAGDLAADGFGIPERNQNAAPVAQAVPWRANRASIRRPFPARSCRRACPMSSGLR